MSDGKVSPYSFATPWTSSRTEETKTLPVGRRVAVTVPATSANLGPGFDSMGMALNWADETRVETISEGYEVEVTGEGADFLPRDKSHLVVHVIRETLREWGLREPGLRLQVDNTIPIGKGLGSSSAAIVAGLAAAWGLAHPDQPLDHEWLLAVSAALEGHADNVGPAVFGEFALTWMEDPQTARAVSLPVHPRIRAMVFVPHAELMTSRARKALPSRIPFEDAKLNLSAAALLVHAMQHDPSQLWAATRDRIHQDYRAELYPDSYRLMTRLRDRGYAACISGAGPTVLVLLDEDQVEALQVDLAVSPLAEAGAAFQKRVLQPGEGAKLKVLAY